jgi:hypothetical protein
MGSMNSKKDHPVTLNTKNPRAAKTAIGMIRRGWTLVEVRDFWTMKLQPPSINNRQQLVKYFI